MDHKAYSLAANGKLASATWIVNKMTQDATRCIEGMMACPYNGMT